MKGGPMTRRLIAATVVLFVVCGPPRDQIAAGAQAAQAHSQRPVRWTNCWLRLRSTQTHCSRRC